MWQKNGKDLTENPNKYEIIVEEKRTALIIKDITMSDSSLYRLIVTAKDQEKSMNFTLRVKGILYFHTVKEDI